MPATPQSVVDSAYSLVQAAQGGFELGNSSNAYQAYNNALNLAGTMAGTGPWAVGLNTAATANNTVAALSAYQSGTLQPSDILQITGSALALAVAAAAIVGAPVTMSCLVLAGTIGIVAGPGPLKDKFNEYATRLGDLMTGGTLGTTPVNTSAISSSIGSESSGDVLVVRQYDNGLSETVTLEVINRNGSSYGEVAHVTGQTVTEWWLPAITVRVSGSMDDPTLSGFPEIIDLNEATRVTTQVLDLTEAQTSSFLNFATGTSATAFTGNSFDYASSAFNALGLNYSTYSNMFSSTSLASQYYGLMDWFSHDTEWYQQYFDPDQEAHERLNHLNLLESKVGAAAGHQEIEDRVWSGIASPIVIDLNGDGVKTIGSFTSGVQFDITGDGVKENTGWLSAEDGFLAMDRNGNGRIDDANEMFGGTERGEGFAELAELDDSGDGVIDATDAAYAALKVWQDANLNGLTDSGELRSLADASVSELRLSYTSQEVYDHANLIGEVSTAVVGGSTAEMADVYFRYRDIAESETVAPVAEKVAGTADRPTRATGIRPRHWDGEVFEPLPHSLIERRAQGLVASLATVGADSAPVINAGHRPHHFAQGDILLAASS